MQFEREVFHVVSECVRGYGADDGVLEYDCDSTSGLVLTVLPGDLVAGSDGCSDVRCRGWVRLCFREEEQIWAMVV